MTTAMQPAISLQPVKSSQISHIGHDAATNTLAVQFHGSNRSGSDGNIYHYPNFTVDQFNAFKAAESIGKHFGANIKKLPFVKQGQPKQD